MPVDQEQLRQTCVYESKAPIETTAAALDEIEGIAAGWHKTRSRLLFAGILTIACSLVGLALFPPVGIVMVALGVYLIYRRKYYPKGVANVLFRCEFTKALSAMLARDTDPQVAATVRLTFDPKRELLSEGVLPNRRNGKQQLYRASWFSVENRLLDGTSFTETIDDLVRERSFTNPRGKSKRKTRTRHLISMRFGYPGEVY